MNKKKLKILVVDDESSIVEIITETLLEEGHIVYSAFSGNSAIKILKEVSVDIIISDFRMPDGNGMELLVFVNGLQKKPTFIFLSGYSDVSPEECIKAGANEFIHKPFVLDGLVSLVLRKYKEVA